MGRGRSALGAGSGAYGRALIHHQAILDQAEETVRSVILEQPAQMLPASTAAGE